MKKSIGILYICTGDYRLFWEGFYKSFEEKFLPDTEKKYYVLTDDTQKILGGGGVSVYHIDALPWPLITLLRFHYFMKIKDEIINNDYLMFANANLVCRQVIHEEEFLPDDEQDLTAVRHPGYWNLAGKNLCYRYPYERRRVSSAYVPYNVGEVYCMGGLYCGHSDSFMHMSEVLSQRINDDFEHRIITLWHDESQLNRYLLENHNVRLLTPAYGYVDGWKLPFENKIEILSKSKFFDVNAFKNYDTVTRRSLPEKICRRLKKIYSRIRGKICFWRDTILRRHI